MTRAALAALLALAVAACGKDAADASATGAGGRPGGAGGARSAIPVEVAVAARRRVEDVIAGTGQIEALQQIKAAGQ